MDAGFQPVCISKIKKIATGGYAALAMTITKKGLRTVNITEWTKQLEALRNGRLRLEGPEESGLTRYASTALYELREYVKALEHGYRHLSAAVRRYESKEKAAEVTGILGLLKHQWSDGACLGYAGMALIQSGMPPHQVVAHLELMEELMEQFDLDYAAEFCQGLKDGGEIATAPVGPRNDRTGEDRRSAPAGT